MKLGGEDPAIAACSFGRENVRPHDVSGKRGPYALVGLEIAQQKPTPTQRTQRKDERQCFEAPEREECRGKSPDKRLLGEQELIQSQPPHALVRWPAPQELWVAQVGGVLLWDVKDVAIRVEIRVRIQIGTVADFTEPEQGLGHGPRLTASLKERRDFEVYGLGYKLVVPSKDTRQPDGVLKSEAPYLSL